MDEISIATNSILKLQNYILQEQN